MDLKDILYSVSTFCDLAPATTSDKPPINYKALDEDAWRQVEFVAVANRDYIQSKLVELDTFKKQHRQARGFTDVFVRPEPPATFQSVGLTSSQLPHLTESALCLGDRTVTGGFALSDTGEWFIYGQRSTTGQILALAVSPSHGSSPSAQVIDAIRELTGTRLLLVDWYASAIVDTSSPESISQWARRYK